MLQKQFRPPINKVVIEIPAGLVDAGESAAESAVRELKEETGYVGAVTEGVGVVMFNGEFFWHIFSRRWNRQRGVLKRVDARESFTHFESNFNSIFTIPAHYILSTPLPENTLRHSAPNPQTPVSATRTSTSCT